MASSDQIARADRRAKRPLAGSAIQVPHVPYQRDTDSGPAPVPPGSRGQAILQQREWGNGVLAGVTTSDREDQALARRAVGRAGSARS